MKRGTMSNLAQPTIRILLVGPHTYQISFRNIYGYLKTVLFDRCKKVGAQYLYYERSYVIHSEKLADLKKEFQDVLNMKTNDQKMKFKIQDFPMTNIKMILKPDKKGEGNDRNKNRIIFIDKSSLNRYFYLKKRIEEFYGELKRFGDRKQKRITLILTSQINRKFWLSNILQPKKISLQQEKGPIMSNFQFPQITQLTYSELSSRKFSPNQNSYIELNKIYLITYDNLKFVENSWILGQIQMVSLIIVDDSEFLIIDQSELSTLQNKKRNFEAFRLLLKNYPIDQQLLFFLSKHPEPVDLYKLLVLTKPKNFSGIKFSTTLNERIFNQSLFTPQQKCMYDEFSSWFRKRYRNQNKSFKQIIYLLKNIVIKTLDDSVFKKTPDLLPSLELSSKNLNDVKITLLESSSDIVEKFRIMDRKYKKTCPSINLKQILEDFHDVFKSSERKFQVTSKIDDHLVNKNSKQYFFQAKQLMLNLKFQMILRRLYFTINTQKQRITVVLQDEKLQKRLKKYFKETQVQYIDYELPKAFKNILNNYQEPFQSPAKILTYTQFDSNNTIKACIININRVHKQYLELKKTNKKFIKKEIKYEFQFKYGQSYDKDFQEILIPKLTTLESVHFIDTFWNQFNFEKQRLLHQIFDFQLSFIEESHKDSKISFKQVHKSNKITQNYFLFDGSHEKVMLGKYLSRKQSIHQVKFQQNYKNEENLEQFISNVLIEEILKFSKCEKIDYLDIDDEFDKIEEQAKKMKNNKDIDPLEQKVFLPKFTKPDCKSFKEMLEQKLLEKNIDEILEGSQNFDEYEKKQQYGLILKDFQVNKVTGQKQQQLKANKIKKQTVKDQKDKDDIDKKQKQLNVQLQLSNIFQQITTETVRLQQGVLSKQPSQIRSNIFQNQPQKDLFDQLLGPDFQYDNSKEQNSNKKEHQLQEVETQSEIDEDKYLIQPKNWGRVQQQPAKDELLLNFGFLAYHNLENQDLKTKSSCLPNYRFQAQQKENKDDSIEIIKTTPLIKRNHSQKLKNNRIPNRIRHSQYLSNKIKSKSQNLPFYELPKQKRLSNKKLYQQAISKSKQLWEKKLRKEKQLLILKSAKFQIDLRPKIGWKQNLTLQEIQTLKMKGIQI